MAFLLPDGLPVTSRKVRPKTTLQTAYPWRAARVLPGLRAITPNQAPGRSPAAARFTP
jgi:hypothetical protein